jgi:two-component system, NarL family, nitrate/nitrite response regulator NarL
VSAQPPFRADRVGARVRVGVIDDHDLILAGARALMNAHNSPAEFVAGTKTVDALLNGAHQLDVALLDVRLSDGSRPEDNVRRLCEAGWAVLLHADLRHREAGPTLHRTHASGVVWKNRSVLTLLEALVTVARGETWSDRFVDGLTINGARLTDRETEVLRAYASGRTYAETAAALEPPIGVESVKTYLTRIRKRYEAAGRPATTRLELRQRALEDGIIAPE